MKCTGSKEQIASELLPIIHGYIIMNNIDTYIEPFVGGCNIIDKVQCKNKIGYDNNEFIIKLFNHLKSIDDGSDIPEEISREQYMDFRAHYNAKDKTYPDWLLAAIGLLTNKNGEMFNNGKISKHFNTNDYIENRNEILEQIKSLHDVELKFSDYRELKPKNSLIYCDAPYSGKNEVDSVTKEFNHKEFWDIMREWSKDNIVLISENKAPSDFDIIWEQSNYDKELKKVERLFIHHNLNKDNINYDF